MKNETITDKQLKQELLENQATKKEIAYRYGYGWPSKKLNQRIRDLDIQKRRKISEHSTGGGLIHVSENTLKQLNIEELPIYYTTKTENQKLVLEIKEHKWTEEEKQTEK